MANHRYKIDSSSSQYAVAYLKKKLEIKTYIIKKLRAKAINSFKGMQVHHLNRLNTWCETYLDNDQWNQMKAAIRAGKSRANAKKIDGGKVTVSLDNKAWKILSLYSKDNSVTMSQAIIDKFEPKSDDQ